MAENTPKITFLSNKPVIVTLKFDEPQTGQNTGKDGKPYTWYRYGVSQKGIDRSIFASNGLHEQIKWFQKDDKLSIEKEEFEKDGKIMTRFKVLALEGATQKSVLDNPIAATSTTGTKTVDWDKINSDKTEDIHKQVCLKLAVDMMGEQAEKLTDDQVGIIMHNMSRIKMILDHSESNAESIVVEDNDEMPF